MERAPGTFSGNFNPPCTGVFQTLNGPRAIEGAPSLRWMRGGLVRLSTFALYMTPETAGQDLDH